MHFIIVLVQCLRVNGLKREWWIDMPELTTILFGDDAFRFSDDDSTELIMRSECDEMNWWIDLPKLITLATEGSNSGTFCNPRSITLESSCCHSILTNRHALSYRCLSCQGTCFQAQEGCSFKEFLFLGSLTFRHYSCSFWLPLISFFHTLLTHKQPVLFLQTETAKNPLELYARAFIERVTYLLLDENNHLVHLDWHHTPIHSPFSSYSTFYGVLFFLRCEKGVNAIDVKTLVVFHECALELK